MHDRAKILKLFSIIAEIQYYTQKMRKNVN